MNKFLVLLSLVVTLLLTPSYVFANHPLGTTGEYCVGTAEGERWRDLPDGNHQFLSPRCPLGTDCKQYIDTNTLDPASRYARCEPRGSTVSPSVGSEPAGLNQIENLVKRIVRLAAGVSFVALFVVLLWAGIKFLTSGGDPKALQSAQQTVVWALLGILFLAIAWLVLQLVAAFTGIEALKVFNIRILCIPGNSIC